MRFCANATVAQQKMANPARKKSTGVTGNNMSRTVGCCRYGSYFKTLVIKYTQQTNNCEVTRKYSVSQGTEGENNKN
jgi:hypothetical protein